MLGDAQPYDQPVNLTSHLREDCTQDNSLSKRMLTIPTHESSLASDLHHQSATGEILPIQSAISSDAFSLPPHSLPITINSHSCLSHPLNVSHTDPIPQPCHHLLPISHSEPLPLIANQPQTLALNSHHAEEAPNCPDQLDTLPMDIQHSGTLAIDSHTLPTPIHISQKQPVSITNEHVTSEPSMGNEQPEMLTSDEAISAERTHREPISGEDLTHSGSTVGDVTYSRPTAGDLTHSVSVPLAIHQPVPIMSGSHTTVLASMYPTVAEGDAAATLTEMYLGHHTWLSSQSLDSNQQSHLFQNHST